LNAWTQTYTIRVRTSADCRVVRQSSVQFARAQFNPHLPSGFLFRAVREYRLPGVTVSEHRFVTIEGVFQGPVVRRGSLILVNRGDGLWYRFRSGVLVVQEREVES